MPFQTFIISACLILIMELGDKTMLTAMCLSAQYRRSGIVLLATMLALTFSTIIAIVIAWILSATLPVEIIIYISGFLFILLGIHSLVKSNSEEVDNCENPGTFLSMFSLVLFSELGDKSQLATLALAAQSLYPLMVFVGAILGFLIVNLLGVVVGKKTSSRISIKTVKKVAGLVFIVFGILIIFGFL